MKMRMAILVVWLMAMGRAEAAEADTTRALHWLAQSARVARVMPDSAFIYGEMALEAARKSGSAKLESRSYSAMAEALQNQSDIAGSMELYLKAIDIAERAGEWSVLPTAYNGLGICYYFLNDLERAELNVMKAAEIKLAQKDFTIYALLLTNLAGLYMYSERYREGIDLMRQAEPVLLENNAEEYLTNLYNTLGGLYLVGLNEPDSAEMFYLKSAELGEKYRLDLNLISTYHNLGELEFRRGNHASALDYLAKAEALGSKGTLDAYMLAVYNTMTEVHEGAGDFAAALEAKKKSYDLSRKIFESEKQKAVEELDMRYQSARKDREIREARLLNERQKRRWTTALAVALLMLGSAVFGLLYYRQGKRAKERLEREKTRIFENIVHEIRTPLTLITGPLGMVKNELRDRPHAPEHIRMIEENSERLVRLVNELLDASKLEQGRYVLTYGTGDLAAFMARVAEPFQRQGALKGIEVEVRGPEVYEKGMYPDNAVEKIVGNLLGNALKYCPTGARVTLLWHTEGGQLHISVADIGPGIPERDLPRIFERFYRLSRDTGKAGSGIGLAMVRELAELAGGTVTAESRPGEGVRFEVKIPMRPSEAGAVSVAAAEDDRRPVLLIAEDDHDILRFAGGLFSDEYRVIGAVNGREGIERAMAEVPDVVLTDLMMPEADGIELLTRLKQNEATSHVPVVVFSAKGALESRLATLRMGADAYVPKPFDGEELRLIVRNLLRTAMQNRVRFAEQLQTPDLDFEARMRGWDPFVAKAAGEVLARLDDRAFSVNELADVMCLSRSQLHRKLAALTDFSTSGFIRMVRLEKARDLLRARWGNVTEVAYACGFESQSYFSRSFAEYFGESPSEVKAAGTE